MRENHDGGPVADRPSKYPSRCRHISPHRAVTDNRRDQIMAKPKVLATPSVTSGWLIYSNRRVGGNIAYRSGDGPRSS